jgi:hypothetical protein
MAGLPTGAYANAEAIYKGLLGLGLSTNAAAGVAGNIYQETHGEWQDVHGLIQQLSMPGAPPSLAAAIKDVGSYIAANGSISAINKNASTPAAAALYFSNVYERAGSGAENQNRVAAAEWIAQAAKSGNWGTSAGTSAPSGSGGSSSSGNITNAGGSIVAVETKSDSESSGIWGDIASGISTVGGLITDPVQATVGVAEGISGFTQDVSHFLKMVDWFFEPSSWVRILAGGIGVFLLVIASLMLYKAAGGSPPKMPSVMPIPVPV